MSLLTNKTVIVIAGPTASGKTAIAVEVAKKFGTSIISADSRQCYKELNIGVARPTEQELEEVTHYFIASHSIQDEITAADFEKYALEKANGLFKTNDIIVMAGGTGLYIKAFCEGLDIIPEVDKDIRNKIIENYGRSGIEWLQKEIQQKDPVFFEKGEIKNPQRMMRALEVIESTGESILHFRKGKKTQRDFNIIKIGLDISKEELHLRINNRVDKMIQAGLEEEAKKLFPFKHLNALQTVGYNELFDHFENKISFSEAIELIKKNTRQYAKRQMTWFKKDNEMNWIPASNNGEIVSRIGHIINK